MEQLWVRRELGDDLFRTVEANAWSWTLLRSNSQSLPGDVYCRCDVYVDAEPSAALTHFALKYPQAKLVSSVE